MIFNLFISLIFSNHLNYSVPFRKNPCGSGIQDVLYINKPIDLEYISNCTYINGSLFINGDYNINNLNKLSNIKGINGYLSIYDSHKIKNLKGLHHLKKIKGSNKYLLKYGLTIKYNNPIDNNTGLCYYDKVYWDKIINSPITIFKNKKIVLNVIKDAKVVLVQVIYYAKSVESLLQGVHVYLNVIMEHYRKEIYVMKKYRMKN